MTDYKDEDNNLGQTWEDKALNDEGGNSLSVEDVSFEKALQELEKVVSSLESGRLTLDESVKKFQKGIELTKVCSEKLDRAEEKINILIQDEDGELKTSPFEPEEDQ